MKTTTTRRAIRGARKRLVLTPPSKKAALLSGTALATGILAGLAAFIATPRPALADPVCVEGTTNFFTCVGTGGTSSQQVISPDGAFTIEAGPGGDPFQLAPTDTIDPAFVINADNESGTFTIFSGSFIDHTATEAGVGLQLNAPGIVTLNVNEGAYISGTTGIVIDGTSSLTGEVTVNVEGSVYGSEGAALEAFGDVAIEVNNHAYNSMVGAFDGDWIHDVPIAVVNNQGGLTAGLFGSGLYIENISGNNGTDGGDAVVIRNFSDAEGDGGVLAGFFNGVYINNVGFGDSESGVATDIAILNNGRFEVAEGGGWDRFAGGLIFGRTLDGVFISEGSGDLLIDNSLTRMGTIDLDQLNPLVYDSESEDGLLFGQLPGFTDNGFTTGIYGDQDGIDFNWLAGDAWILNADGQITGAEGDGITFANVMGSVFIDNSGTDGGLFDIGLGPSLPGDGSFGDVEGDAIFGGKIWGGVNGIDGVNVGEFSEDGGVFLNNNARGYVFGVENGILLSETEVFFATNLGGSIEGYYDDGINLSQSKMGLILNGGWQDGEGMWHEGRILGGDSAIRSSSDKFGLFNLPGGLIIGDGDDLDGQAVMQLTTASDLFGPYGGGAIVFNAGIMGSQNNPHVDRTWYFPEINEIPEYTIDSEQIVSDVNEVALFAMSGGVLGSVSGLGGLDELTINDYQQTASDGLIHSEGGALFAINLTTSDGLSEGEGIGDWMRDEGIMFGRIVATGAIYDCFELGCEGEGDEIIGNTVLNMGTWFTTNYLDWEGAPGADGGNILMSEGHDAIYNLGFVQTAFGGTNNETEDGDYTSFVLDDFYNGSLGTGDVSEGEVGLLFGPGSSGAGWLSMVDGDAMDETYIFGNFHGASSEGFSSYLAVDANLMTDGRSDVLEIGALSEGGPHNLFGSTGIVVNDLSPNSGDVVVGTHILVVTASGLDMNHISEGGAGNTCFYEWCQTGDTFFISDLNPNYVEVSGIGFIRDGMYMWGLTEYPTDYIPDPEFYFVADWGPDAYQQPTLITAAQTAWYETGGVVEDHVYGNVFPQQGAGGAGADLTYDPAPMLPPPAAAKSHSSAIWGRLTGSWANRDTEVIVDEGGPGELTFDTGYDQDTYGLQGGLEFRPSGDGDFRLGVFGGYVGSHVSYDDYGASATLKGPTVGAYAALVSGGFYVDAEVKGDFLSVEYTTPTTDVSTRATSVGVLANAGYRMEGNGGFIEPIVSLAYVNTRLDDASGGGADISYSNGTSFRGGVGARVGTTVVNANGTSTEFDLLGKIWNEFGSANTVTIDDGVNPPETFTDGITGVFGEVVGRATVYSADRRTSGFVSAGAKFGTDWTTLQAKAGVRQGF